MMTMKDYEMRKKVVEHMKKHKSKDYKLVEFNHHKNIDESFEVIFRFEIKKARSEK